MLRTRQPQRFEKGRQRIDGLHQALIHRAPADIGRRARITHDQRHTHRRLEEKLLFAQAVVAEEIAVIAGEHDQRVIPAPIAL
ncbi:hypothetical protein D3C79_1001370 [compost metagenome]